MVYGAAVWPGGLDFAVLVVVLWCFAGAAGLFRNFFAVGIPYPV
jgi:hypothetical protein